MPVRVSRAAAVGALALSVGLACLPACKKKPTESEGTPGTNRGSTEPGPNQPGQPNDARPADAPRSPVFRANNPNARAKASNHMKMIGLAMHNYHDQNGFLPGGFLDKTGKPGLSWRVAILPYIEYDNLYKQFKLDEPWDSPHNKALIPQMPPIYAPPGERTNGYTFYRAPIGEQAWLTPAALKGAPGQPIRGLTLARFSDGTSNTIMVAEAWDPVIWTKPDELEVGPNKPPALFGVFDSGGFVLFGDGSVRFVKKSVSAKTLAALATANGGEVIEDPDF